MKRWQQIYIDPYNETDLEYYIDKPIKIDSEGDWYTFCYLKKITLSGVMVYIPIKWSRNNNGYFTHVIWTKIMKIIPIDENGEEIE